MAHNNQDMIDVAERIRTARKLAGETQESMARALDVTMRTYARWEAADTFGFMERIDEIAEIVKASRAQLLGPLAEDRIDRIESSLSEMRAILDDLAKRLPPGG